MRGIVFISMAIFMICSSSGLDNYDEFISGICQSCENPSHLLTVAFTNNVITYRASNTNLHVQCAADLALAISLMHRMDRDEACCANDECFAHHQSLVSNIVYCVGLEEGAWVRYAAAAEYMAGLNYGNQEDAAFVLSTNMIERIMACPPNMGQTNYWNSMSVLMKNPQESLLSVFRLNAAVWLAEHNRLEEIVPLTNSLPESAMAIFHDELGF